MKIYCNKRKQYFIGEDEDMTYWHSNENRAAELSQYEAEVTIARLSKEINGLIATIK